jgi:hypothetical protein
MNFKCINNTDVEDLLTIGKVYKGVNRFDLMVRIFRCDDKKDANFMPSRFEEIPDTMSLLDEPEVHIFQSFVTIEKN